MPAAAYVDLIASFTIGSIPFGWIVSKLWGIPDIRRHGSSNIGATNVVRTAGVVPGALTFLLDFAKGLAPVLYFPDAAVWIGLAAVAGHCFSPFLSFRGGKGVSTTLGALVGFHPLLGGAAILAYLVTLAITRVSALGSLFAMLTALFGALLFAESTSARIGIAVMVVLVLARHRDNWNRLLQPGALLLALVGTAVSLTVNAAPLTDFRGKPVDATHAPRRVVALMPSLAETIADLGAGDRLVGVPEYSRLPAKLAGIARIGPYNRISAEAVYALRPDLALASMDGNDPPLVEQLERLGVRVVTVNTRSLADIVRSIEIVAAAVGSRSQQGVGRLRDALAATPSPKRAVDKPARRVFVQVGWDPLVTISGNTFIDELVRLAGGSNVFADARMTYPRPNPEEVIARSPEVLIICKLTDSGDEAERSLRFWTQFKEVPAVKNGRVFIMPGDWLTKPGFPLIRGLSELRKVL